MGCLQSIQTDVRHKYVTLVSQLSSSYSSLQNTELSLSLSAVHVSTCSLDHNNVQMHHILAAAAKHTLNGWSLLSRPGVISRFPFKYHRMSPVERGLHASSMPWNISTLCKHTDAVRKHWERACFSGSVKLFRCRANVYHFASLR